MKLNGPLYCLQKINSKWIKDLTVRPQEIKLLEKKIGGKLLDTVLVGTVPLSSTSSPTSWAMNFLDNEHKGIGNKIKNRNRIPSN